MSDQLEELLESLLFEGYALYPYTAAATKNATPTPFGILYPPAYAAASASTFDGLELRCVLDAPAQARIAAEVRFLAATGERHRAVEHRLALDELAVASLDAGGEQPAGAARRSTVSGADGELEIELTLSGAPLPDGATEVVFTVRNVTDCEAPDGRAEALARSLISTHPVLRASSGRFRSPLDSGARSVNTFPVLASDTDDALIGATIVLGDHPRIAPQSRGSLFDATEIEEALLLHVLALSDAERAQIAREDPRVAAMVERAATATPQELLSLHGGLNALAPATVDGTAGQAAGERPRRSDAPPQEPMGLADPSAGEAEAEVDGVRFRRGGRVRLRPDADADLHARMLAGRTARIERILVDYDGKVHLGVTVDDDPGQQLLSESGRFLFFFAPEVEVIR